MDEMTEFERQYPILLKENAELREKIAELDKLHQRDVMIMGARAAELQSRLDAIANLRRHAPATKSTRIGVIPVMVRQKSGGWIEASKAQEIISGKVEAD